RITWLAVDQDGMLDLTELRDSLAEDTALVSIMLANNETGVIFPIEQIGEIVKAKGIPFHVDAVQAAGKLPLIVKNSPIDLLTISGHKFHGPKGVGALYVRRGIAFPSFFIGGHQERGRRAGTENVVSIIGMGKAAEIAVKHLDEDSMQIRKLRDQLQESLLNSCPGARLIGHRDNRLPNTLNISFRYLEGESILVLLDQHGICASTGSACTAGSAEPSHVLRAMGIPPDWVQGAVRFSLSRLNSQDEVRCVNETMPLIVKRLEGLSALGKLGAQQKNQPSAQIISNNIGARG
ncbi:MAG: aminotransferase class V-fold PLP-dependent enzyme, partial [Pyrinomonadaceae bacterium]